MSTAEAGASAPSAMSAPAPVAPSAPVARLRLLRAELRLVFRRRRNRALLGVVAAIPIIVAIALRLAAPQASGPGGNGGGPPFLDQVAGNGVFLTFLPLPVMLTLVLPL